MTAEIESLQITDSELENILELDISAAAALEFHRALVYRNSQALLSVLLNECVVGIFIFAVVMPVSLLVNRSAGTLSNDPGDVRIFFAVLAVIIILSLFVLNLALWQRLKSMQSLAKLLEEIEKYNQAVRAIAAIAQLTSTSDSAGDLTEEKELGQFLQTIRQSLIDALQIEKIARSRQDLQMNRYDLLTKLEVNLTTVVSSDVCDRANQYQEMLDDTRRISLAVRQELERLKQRI